MNIKNTDYSIFQSIPKGHTMQKIMFNSIINSTNSDKTLRALLILTCVHRFSKVVFSSLPHFSFILGVTRSEISVEKSMRSISLKKNSNCNNIPRLIECFSLSIKDLSIFQSVFFVFSMDLHGIDS